MNGGERTNVRPVTEALFILTGQLTGSKVIFFSWHWPVVLLLNTSESALLEILNHYWIEQLSKIWNIFSLLHWLCKKKFRLLKKTPQQLEWKYFSSLIHKRYIFHYIFANTFAKILILTSNLHPSIIVGLWESAAYFVSRLGKYLCKSLEWVFRPPGIKLAVSSLLLCSRTSRFDPTTVHWVQGYSG